MNKKEVKLLAKNIMFDLSDKEAQDIAQDFKTLDKMLEFFDSINTDGIEEMVYPFDMPCFYLRDDIPNHTITNEDVMLNAPKYKDGYIVVPKVVK